MSLINFNYLIFHLIKSLNDMFCYKVRFYFFILLFYIMILYYFKFLYYIMDLLEIFNIVCSISNINSMIILSLVINIWKRSVYINIKCTHTQLYDRIDDANIWKSLNCRKNVTFQFEKYTPQLCIFHYYITIQYAISFIQ